MHVLVLGRVRFSFFGWRSVGCRELVVQASGHVSVLDAFGRVVDKEESELRESIRRQQCR